MDQAFRVVVLTPAGPPDPSLAIAASRAGELGVLDLEYANNREAALSCIAKLGRHATNDFGIKLGDDPQGLLAELVSEPPDGLGVVILASSDQSWLTAQVEKLRQCGISAIVEATSLEGALAGATAGADGLIAKGNEAGGLVGEETSFVLLQLFRANVALPIWVHGGVGMHTAAACYVAGAAGVVLDSQLLLTRESPLPEHVKAAIRSMDGSETVLLGSVFGQACRVYAKPGTIVVKDLSRMEDPWSNGTQPPVEMASEWQRTLRQRVGWSSTDEELLLIGQDAAFASRWAALFQTTGGILKELRKSIADHYRLASDLLPLDEGSPLAQSHGTRFPIVQGPMTRVSDCAEFASDVAEHGALPFLALALMRAPEVKRLLQETSHLLGNRPWGVGILGFVPPQLYQEQLEAIRESRPPFALIAGGRLDQARVLEKEGIPTYLHVPSARLLKLFLDGGATRFVFEGRECGGHVGPLSSFVLWETMIEVLLDWFGQARDASVYHVLFAGGIHDSLSSSMVATLAAPLAKRGVRVGVLLGTAYVCTEEAVSSRAITNRYQQVTLDSTRTVLLETGVGHSTRVADTPYVETFQRKREELQTAGLPPEEVRDSLERMNIGRLRVATKGIDRNPDHGNRDGAPEFLELSEEEQHTQGTYMIGQIAALRSQPTSIEDLHRDVSVEGSQRIRTMPIEADGHPSRAGHQASEIAIIGMGCNFPAATDLNTFWANILNKVDAITEVPEERWDWRAYHDSDRKARDKIYSKWGGFLDEIPFDPVSYGIPPNTLPSIEPVQLLTLEVVRAALDDAGYGERPFERERTAVVLGAGGGVGDVGIGYIARSTLPALFGSSAKDIISSLDGTLPEWTEDSFPGILMNVAAGRVANRFDLGGMNCTIDAACASSLAAIDLAVKELDSHNSDMVIAGGIDTMQSPFAFLAFSSAQALSPSGRCRPYDATADGISISEGLGILILKRLSDAERDGDRIYAVIRGVGASSDGRGTGLIAPNPEGQMRALQRAYDKAGVSPAMVGLIEGHGTGTVVGDHVETKALTQFFDTAQAAQQSCALGSVKSMIGHTKCAAGAAGLIKTSLALHHKILPPTLGVSQPNPKVGFSESPFYVNTEARPWMSGGNGHPRYAGVSAFGFGGINYHVVVEEYTRGYLSGSPSAPLQEWPCELFIWRESSREKILDGLADLGGALERGARPSLNDLAWTVALQGRYVEEDGACLAIVASSTDDLAEKLAMARQSLANPTCATLTDPKGIYFAEWRQDSIGKVAFLFPGQGSQYVNMLRDLAIHFPEVKACFEKADAALRESMPNPLSAYVFPPPTFTEADARANEQRLTDTNIAQPALAAAGLGMLHLLRKLGVEADVTAGHSFGEFVALCAAGAISEEDLFTVAEARGRFIVEESGQDLGTMAAVYTDHQTLAGLIQGISGTLVISNLNSPKQSVISGERPAVDQAVQRCKKAGVRAVQLPVGCAFHSPLVAGARDRLADYLSTIEFRPTRVPVFSNTTADVYPTKPEEIAALLVEHLVRPVNFVGEIEAMYRDGVRVFVEVGPRGVLTGLVDEILGGRADPVLTAASDRVGRQGLLDLHHLLGKLAANGIGVRADRLFDGRRVRKLDLGNLGEGTGSTMVSSTTWLVNGGRARPANQDIKPNGDLKNPTSLRVESPGNETAATPPSLDGAQSPPVSSSNGTVETSAAVESNPLAVGNHSEGVPVAHSTPVDDQVFLQYQQLMNRFLDTQKQVMLTYLQGDNIKGASRRGLQARPAHVESRVQPSPPRELAPNSAVTQEGPSAAPAAKTALETQGAERPPEREDLTRRLVAIASERTGYPEEMIDLDANLEADLGIDSIKRVEIIASVLTSIGQPEQTEAILETLSSSRTLREIIDQICNGSDSRPSPQALFAGLPAGLVAEVNDHRPLEGGLARANIQRSTLRATETPVPVRVSLPGSGRVFVLTDDEMGVAESLAQNLRDQGQSVALVRMGEGAVMLGPGHYQGDITSPVGVAQVVELIRQRQGLIGGLVHLVPLRPGTPFEQMDMAGWKQRLQLDVKSLFLLCKELAQELSAAAQETGAVMLAATAMGGAFGHDGAKGEIFPGHGGVVGLTKTIAAEWAGVRVKAIDFDLGEAADDLAGKILTEMMAEDQQVEVGYAGPRRLVLRLVLDPVATKNPELTLDSSSLILVTGGARGITAEAAMELAERYQPTLVLLGRTPCPGDETEETAGLTSPQEIKGAFIKKMRQLGVPDSAAAVEEMYNRLLREREIRKNIAALERTGSRVSYHQVDVCDEEAMGALIDELYRTHGRIDGVIHGAGTIEDKLVKDKDPDSFDRVFGTKTDSVFILSRKLKPESLKFLALFSSVSARFGNRGQGDYAAANEVLNKLAVHLDHEWPGRVVSINWGPWMSGGMVSPEVARSFAQRGVELVPTAEGRRMLDEELRYGRKGEVEIVIGGSWENGTAHNDGAASPSGSYSTEER